jgi:hypothetical protein
MNITIQNQQKNEIFGKVKWQNIQKLRNLLNQINPSLENPSLENLDAIKIRQHIRWSFVEQL